MPCAVEIPSTFRCCHVCGMQSSECSCWLSVCSWKYVTVCLIRHCDWFCYLNSLTVRGCVREPGYLAFQLIETSLYQRMPRALRRYSWPTSVAAITALSCSCTDSCISLAGVDRMNSSLLSNQPSIRPRTHTTRHHQHHRRHRCCQLTGSNNITSYSMCHYGWRHR